MNDNPNLALGLSVLLLIVLYFGFDTRSSRQKDKLTSVRQTGIGLEVNALLDNVKKTLTTEDINPINRLEAIIETSEGPEKIKALKELSGIWYRLSQYYLAGHYAGQVAELESTGESWGIAATSYLPGITDQDEAMHLSSLNKAIEAFEKAISLEPENNAHRVNLALIYAEYPPEGEPMKAVQMLLALNEKNPEDVLVLNALGRLAIKTGQWERAKERLERADSLQPSNPTTVCLLADVYAQTESVRADDYKKECQFLTSKR